MKCANCQRNARHTYEISPSQRVHYCSQCLPRFLAARKAATGLPLILPTDEVKPAKKAKAEPVVEEPVVEEPEVVEDDATN